MLDRDTLTLTMREAGVRAYPKEACGVIVAAGKKAVVIECRNVSPEPKGQFIIDPQDYTAAADRGEIIGIWHTHPDFSSEASDADRVGCENSELPWFILGLHKGDSGFWFDELSMIEPCGFEMPYVGRPFAMGVLDCYTMLTDFYEREFGVEITDYPRIEASGRMGFTYFTERYEGEGFVSVMGQEPKLGDVFFTQSESSPVPDHILIYIGNDTVMHHAIGRLSRRETYGGSVWQQRTTHHLRHVSQC